MTERFENLKKVSTEPAMRMMAAANARFKTEVGTPVSAPVGVVLDALSKLDTIEARMDMLRLMTVALPMRELVWWSCLAGRDVAGPDADPLPGPLIAAEKWVFEPSDDNRDACRASLDLAEPDDDTTFCAQCVAMHDGKLGTGELNDLDAPPGVSSAMAFGMNMLAVPAISDNPAEALDHLLERSFDIARGGNGKSVPRPVRAVVNEDEEEEA